MRRFWLAAAGVTAIVAILGAVALHVKAYRVRQANAAALRQRNALFEMLQPVALTNCQLERFGETNDGGYLMCGNLLGGVQSGYSYGIAGYDQWGCDISTKFNLTVHEYDCFNTTQPECPKGAAIFHAECVGNKTERVEGRFFDTVRNQLAKNGDSAKRIVLKMDVEGAEWDSLLSAPDEVLEQIDQIAVEFHWVRVDMEAYFRLIQRLKRFFEVGHIHFNNATCFAGLAPFPAFAYEVLFVSKRLAVVDRSRKASSLHPLDAPNIPSIADCQRAALP